MKSDKEILAAAKGAKSTTEVMRRLGLVPHGYAHHRFKIKLNDLGVVLEKRAWNKGKSLQKKPIEEILVINGPVQTSSKLRKRLIREGLKENKCEECGLGPEWNNKPLSLQLDHANGNRADNRLINLRILCPNCHTQTPSYSKVKNKSKLKQKQKVYKCIQCGKILNCKRKTGCCANCIKAYIQKRQKNKSQ
jgi:hypothetical protein